MTSAASASGPWKQLGADIVGPFYKLPSQFRLAITLVGYICKWPEVSFCRQVTAEVICDFLVTIFSREGYPEVIVSDHGPQFRSHTFQEFLKSRGISHHRSAIYNFQANGQVERFNRVFKVYVKTIIQEKGGLRTSLEEYLGMYRSTPHATRKLSPAELLHGRKMRIRLDVVGFPCLDKPVYTQMQQLRQRVANYQKRSKVYTERRKRAKPFRVGVGDV